MRDDIAIERRLEIEARQHLGSLAHASIPDVAGQGAKVEVWWDDDGTEHAGYFSCCVPLGSNPYDASRELVEAEAERRGWERWEISDTRSW
jgi:hypothetical protein